MATATPIVSGDDLFKRSEDIRPDPACGVVRKGTPSGVRHVRFWVEEDEARFVPGVLGHVVDVFPPLVLVDVPARRAPCVTS